MTDLFETAMNFAEKVDNLIGGRGMRIVALILLIVVLLAYAYVPSPYEPMMPCPQDGTRDIGLEPSLWWVGGGPTMSVLSGLGLDPNSKIAYEVLLGTSENDLAVIGTATGGRCGGLRS